MFDRVQEVTVLDRLQERRTDSVQLVAAGCEIMDQRIEPTAIDTWLTLELLQDAELVVEFLVHITAHIAA